MRENFITISSINEMVKQIFGNPKLPGCHTHGETYEEAIKNGIEVIELWLETAKDLGWPIPKPRVTA